MRKLGIRNQELGNSISPAINSVAGCQFLVSSSCGYAVEVVGEILGQVGWFCALSTNSNVGLVGIINFVRNFGTSFTQFLETYTHKFPHFNPPYVYVVLPTFHRSYKYY